MSHSSDKNSLSEPLRVETEENGCSNGSNFYEEEKESYSNSNNADDVESLGPLPPKWEKAYTESGEVYFIDHSTGTSHWLDPRLSKFQKKSLEDCMDDELPYGWEKISDPHYGTYFIDHVNRKTQYENPVIQAKRAASQSSTGIARASFTKDPAELCGQRYRTSLVKSSRGLGFTIVGGDDGVDEFLQIKSVVPNGPAWLDGQLQMGDVIVYVNDICVLGYTHNQIVHLFQSISVGSVVSLELCRGYPLPFDPNDPNTEVVTTIAVDSHLHSVPVPPNLDTNYNFLDGDDISRDETNTLDTTDDIDDLLKGINNLTMGKVEVKVSIIKGNLGFGFTIADSACGQRVKKILDRQRCKDLMEGDILLEINGIALQNMSHDDVVQVLKNCPHNSEATISVQRGCTNKPINPKNKSRKLDNRLANKDIDNIYRSKTPTADIYSTQPREILPSRPKTPLVDTRTRSKTPIKDLTSPDTELYTTKRDYNGESVYNPDCSCLRLSLIENTVVDDDDVNNHKPKTTPQDPKFGVYLPVQHRYDCTCFNCVSQRPLENIDSYDSPKKNVAFDWWQYSRNPEYVQTFITLNRQDTGFGFRIVGGIEDKSQVKIVGCNNVNFKSKLQFAYLRILYQVENIFTPIMLKFSIISKNFTILRFNT